MLDCELCENIYINISSITQTLNDTKRGSARSPKLFAIMSKIFRIFAVLTNCAIL